MPLFLFKYLDSMHRRKLKAKYSAVVYHSVTGLINRNGSYSLSYSEFINQAQIIDALYLYHSLDDVYLEFFLFFFFSEA